MLNIERIAAFYPEHLRHFQQNLLREYFQHKILEIIFDSPYGQHLAFMGGTALRIIHGIGRFSEDLDFDNLGLTRSDFLALSGLIQKKMSMEGYQVEIKNVFHGAFRTSIRISGVLFESGLSAHKGAKVLIQVDTQKQSFTYQPEMIVLNKFDVFLRIQTVPADILLAQKIYAIFNRKRSMGRDYYDAVFLLGRTRPNMDYLALKMNIQRPDTLKERLLDHCDRQDFKRLTADVEPFLMNPGEIKKVVYFKDYIKNCPF